MSKMGKLNKDLINDLIKRRYAYRMDDGEWAWTKEAIKKFPPIIRITLSDLVWGKPCHDFMQVEMMRHGFDPDTGLELE